MTDNFIKQLIKNGHFAGYGRNHKKAIHKKVRRAKTIADRCLRGEERSPVIFSSLSHSVSSV